MEVIQLYGLQREACVQVQQWLHQQLVVVAVVAIEHAGLPWSYHVIVKSVLFHFH